VFRALFSSTSDKGQPLYNGQTTGSKIVLFSEVSLYTQQSLKKTCLYCMCIHTVWD